MQVRSFLTKIAALGSLSVAAPFAAEGSQDAMLELFKILRDRGSISNEEYQQLMTLAEKEHESGAKEGSTLTTAPSIADTSALKAMDRMERRLAEGEQRLAKIEKASSELKDKTLTLPDKKSSEKWYEKLKIDGYAQFRQTALLDDDAQLLHVPADRSVDPDESFVIRRGRFKISGNVTERLYLYSQFGFLAE